MKSTENFFISIIAPCRNEKEYIERCIESVIAQDYPKEKMEFLIADGMSEDGTREIIQAYEKKYPFIKLLDNPKQYTPSALNIAIKASKGEIIIRVDSHAMYEKDYIKKCVTYLSEYHADNVGGIMKTIPASSTLVAKSIARCMSHTIGVGGSRFRTGSKKVIPVDTVFGGCYRKKVFNEIGLFNEHLMRSQDLDFNLRLKRAGGKILLVPDIVSYYYPKSTFKDFLKHNFIDGQWAILPLKFTKSPFTLRHYVLLAFVSLLFLLMILSFLLPVVRIIFFLTLGCYVLAILLSSFFISLQERDNRYFFVMPIAFIIRHFGYGFGELLGVFRLLI